MDDAKTIQYSPRARRNYEIGLLVVASLVAAVNARNYAGGWNDGSRLATVESLVDRHTLAIDDSIFVRSSASADATNPYCPGNELLRTKGTQDKLLIAGHYYSDKSPLPAFWLAGWYQVIQSTSGLTARQNPRLFCYLMTLLSSGVAYVVTLWSIWRLALRKGLPLATCLLLAASAALATIALPYVRHVNNHILLLAVVSLLMMAFDRLAGSVSEPLVSKRTGILAVLPLSPSPTLPLLLSAAAGTLAALGYTLDLGVGPVLLLATAALVTYRTRSLMAMGCFMLAALPWLAAHHAVNYATGSTFGPANSIPEYLAWPGSPFSTQNMTGGWAHHNVGHFFIYAAALLFGKHGFLNYNLPVFLALAGLLAVLRRRPAELPEFVFATAFSGGTWLLYAALSNNYSGPCCSIRWYVPLLAPAFYVLILIVRDRPALARDLALLTVFGAMLGTWLWWRGPWEGTVPLMLWPINALALLVWAASAALRTRKVNKTTRKRGEGDGPFHSSVARNGRHSIAQGGAQRNPGLSTGKQQLALKGRHSRKPGD